MACASNFDEEDRTFRRPAEYKRMPSYSTDFNSTDIKSIIKQNLNDLILQLDSCLCHSNKSSCPVEKEIHQMLGRIVEIQQGISHLPKGSDSKGLLIRQPSFDSASFPRPGWKGFEGRFKLFLTTIQVG